MPRRRPYTGGMPLSSAFESGRRGLEDSLSQQLARVASQRGRVQPMLDLSLARLGTDEGQDRELTFADQGSRGIAGSGAGNEQMTELGARYDRSRQDLSFDTQNLLSDLALAESEAQMGYTSGLSELLLQLAQQQGSNRSLMAPRRRRNRRQPPGRR